MKLNIILAAVLLLMVQMWLPFAPVYFFIGALAAIIMLALGLYQSFGGQVRRFDRIAWIAVLVMIFFGAVLPTADLIVQRHRDGPATHVHDNPISLEAAVDFIKQGKNPYTEDYTSTALADWVYDPRGNHVNPALYHFIALPGHPLISLISSFPLTWIFGYFDERMIYLAALAIALTLIARLGRDSVQSMRYVILLGLNPISVPYIVDGRNDILVFVFLLAAAVTLNRQRNLSALLFALACTIKMFAWAFLPVYLVALIGSARGATFFQRLRSSVIPLLILVGVITAIILPFVTWDGPAFYDDIVRYSNGTSPTSYPIRGLGISSALLQINVIRAATDYYPFWIFQLLTVIPALLVFWPKLYRQPSPAQMLFTGTLLLFLVIFFSRFFNENYLGLLSMLVVAGFALREREGVRSALPG